MQIEEVEGLSFPELAELKNYKVFQADQSFSKKGIDYHLKGVYKNPRREVNLLFAVKRRKQKNPSKYLDRWTWIEFNKTKDEDGWIYGPSHFVAFERSHDYVIINRKVLLDYVSSSKCKVRWDMPFVKDPRDAKYKIYNNPRSGARITQILTKDIIKLPGAQVWSKHPNAES